MARSKRVDAALTVLTVASVPALFRDLDTGDQLGEAIALGAGVGVGAATSVVARTPWPLLASIAMCLFMLHVQGLRASRGVSASSAVATMRP